MTRSFLNPLSELQQMIDTMDRAFNTTWPKGTTNLELPEAVYAPPVDIWEKDNTYFIRAAVPGVTPADIDIQLRDTVLTLSGETRHEAHGDKGARFWRQEYMVGRFSRSIRLPDNIDVDRIEATFDSGFVTVSVPMMPEVRKSIKVNLKEAEAPRLKAITKEPDHVSKS